VKFGTTGTLPAPLKAWAQDRWKSYYVRDSTLTTLKLAEYPGGPAIDIIDSGSGTHGMSFAGYMQIWILGAGFSKPVTCDPDTDICNSPGHGWVLNSGIYFSTTGTMPGGLVTRYGLLAAKYCVTPVDSDNYQLRYRQVESSGTDQGAQVPCSDSRVPATFVDITSEGTGDLVTYGGTGNFYVWSITGYPPGTTFMHRRGGQLTFAGLTGTGSKRQFSVNEDLTMIAKVPSATPPGNYPIEVITSESASSLTNEQTTNFVLRAKLLTPLSKIGPSLDSYTEIPGLARWEDITTRATNGGGADDGIADPGFPTYPYPRCPNPENPTFNVDFPNSGGQQIWFYDGGESYYEMAKYFNDTKWNNCGRHIASDVANTMLTGTTQGYFYAWIRNLLTAFGHTREYKYRQALLEMSNYASASPHPYMTGSAYDTRIREQAWAFARLRVRQKLLGTPTYYEEIYATALIGMLEEISNGDTLFIFHQPFMAGFTFRELVDYYKDKNDERVPVIAKAYMDRFWSDWYVQSTKNMMYNPEPYGPKCYVDCGETTGSILNMMVAPTAAFVWRLTGDNIYRDYADDMFYYQFTPTLNIWPYQAKNWSEMQNWVWKYLNWRTGKEGAH
jgi:hypothetical protein